MKYPYKNNMITRSKRAILYFLLFCQLLTSCGGNEILLSLETNSPLTNLIQEQQLCNDDSQPQLYTQRPNFIDGTPLKLGQPEIKFAWDKEEGLQAFTIDLSMGSKSTYLPIGIPSVINPVNGCNKIVLSELNKKQTEAVVKSFKWEVTKAGELKERGVRVCGGGKKGSDQGDVEKHYQDFYKFEFGTLGRWFYIGDDKNKWYFQEKDSTKCWKQSSTHNWVYKQEGDIRDSNGWKHLHEQEYNQAASGSGLGSLQGQGSIDKAATPDKPSRSKKKGGTPSDRGSQGSRSSRDSRHTDCSNNSQQEIYHSIVNGVIKDFFRDYFKTSPYLPNPTIQKASDIDTSTDSSNPTMQKVSDIESSTDSSIQTHLASIHNHKKKIINSHVQKNKLLPEHLADKTTGEPKGLNVVIALITFFDKENNEIIKTYIKCGSNFLSPYKDKIISDKLERKNRHKELITTFNQSLFSFLSKNPDILKPKVKVKEDDGVEKEIDNSLLNKGKYSGIPVYDVIKANITKTLDAPATRQKYQDLKRLEEKSEEERIILKSIISARRHSEEALAEYMRSNEFYKQLDDLLKEKKEKLNRIRIDVYSTKESCLPCQITLRCVRHALEEKFFGKDIAETMETGRAEEEAREQAEKKNKIILIIKYFFMYRHRKAMITIIKTQHLLLPKQKIRMKTKMNTTFAYNINTMKN